MTIHTRVCMSKDHVSGDVNVKPDDLMKEENSVIDAKSVWEGCLGGIECAFCKHAQQLLMGEEKIKRTRLGVDKFKIGCTDRVLKLVKKWVPHADIAFVASRKRKNKSAGKSEDSVGKNEDNTE